MKEQNPPSGPGDRENVWVYDEQTGEYILRDGDGTVHARFETAADIFTDASAYPDVGKRNIKPPVIPEYEMDGDLSAVEWDVILVPPETQTPMDLLLYEGDEQTPLTDLPTDDEQATDNNRDARGSDSGGDTDDCAEQDESEQTRDDADGDGFLEDDLSNVFN